MSFDQSTDPTKFDHSVPYKKLGLFTVFDTPERRDQLNANLRAIADELELLAAGGVPNQIDWKDNVRTVATSDITLSGEQTLNSVLTSNDRVGVSGQADTSENGIYDTDLGPWTRADDADEDDEVTQGMAFMVIEGDKEGFIYLLTTPDPITVGVTGLDFAELPPNPPHAPTHEKLGSDEINVTDLSGELADPQKPKLHAPDHSKGGPDEVTVEDLGTGSVDVSNVLKPDGAGGLVMADLVAGDLPPHTHVEADITDLDHTDVNAVHVNEAAEISGVALKATPGSGDLVLIEDVSDSDNKKRTTAGAIAASGPPAAHTHVEADISDLDHTDDDAIHDNVASEISAIAEKLVLTGDDLLVIEDSADGNAKKRVKVSNLPGGTDPNAIHDNVAAEIVAITEKVDPINADVIVIEDSAAGDAKKRVELGKINESRWRTHNTPPDIGSNQNNYDPGDANAYRLTATGSARNITGLAPTGGNSLNGHGRVITLWNVGSVDIILIHQSGSSTDVNRILVSGNDDLTISANGRATLWYDPTTQRWRISTGGGDA